MRWFWIDRFVEFESGRKAVAIKNISFAEEQIPDYIPAYPVMPSSLIIEGLAQTGGLLVGEHNGFRERVVLAKIGKAVFHQPAKPGDTLTYTAEVEDIRPNGAFVAATSHIGDQLQAEANIMFAHLDDRFDGVELFNPAEFIGMLRAFGLYRVGKNADGTPLTVPPHLLAAEQAMLGDDA